MRIEITCLTTLLVAVAIAAAPAAIAVPLPKICLPTDTETTCQRPGNAETAGSVPAESLLPFGTMSHRLGGR